METRGTRTERALGALEGLISSLDVPETFRQLLREHLSEGRTQASSFGDLPAVKLPWLVYSATAAEEDIALAVAGACALVYLGADLLDNVADDELAGPWLKRSRAEAELAGATYLAALVPLGLAQLDGSLPASRLWSMMCVFAEGMIEMSAGQYEDLSSSAQLDPRACRNTAERKSGAEFEMFARAAAVAGTDDATIVDTFAEVGRCFGTAIQVSSDVYDLWSGDGRDLSTGVRTLPVVHALATLAPSHRGSFEDLLREASTSVTAHEDLKAALDEAGSIRYATLTIEVYRQRALRLIGDLILAEPWATELRLMIDEISLIPLRIDGPARK